MVWSAGMERARRVCSDTCPRADTLRLKPPSPALLRAIADKLIPGIPENLRILLAGQVESALDEVDGKADELTVLQVVVKSDRKREAALKEYTSAHRLSVGMALALTCHSVLESVATPEDAGRAIAEVNLERARAQLTVARKVADRRSGARGAEARKVLLAAEAGFKEAEERQVAHSAFCML